MDVSFIVIIGFSEIISLCCLVNLWRGQSNIFVKILWSLILIIPILGPTFYGAMYPSPPESHDWGGGIEA
jgi:hypothetical protein